MSDRPTTLLISPFFDTATPSGGVLGSIDVTREWLRRGRSVTVLCSTRARTLGDLQPYADEGQLILHQILSSDQVRFTHHIHQDVADLTRDVMDECKPDVIHVHNIQGMLAAVQAAIASPMPVVLTALDFGLLCFNFYLYQGTAKPCGGPASPERCAECVGRTMDRTSGRIGTWLPRRITRKLWPRFVRLDQIQSARELHGHMRSILRGLNAIIAPSPGMAERLAQYGAWDEGITEILYGVSPDKIVRPAKSASESLRFGFLGGSKAIKGFDVLAEATDLLPDRLPLDIHAIGGDGMQKLLEKQSARVKRYIRFQHALFGQELAQAHADLDAVLVPSVWHENSPFVVLESFANGTPVIGSDEPGISHLILPDHNGWLVKPGQPAAWARAFIEAVQRPARIRRMQHNARFSRTTVDFVNDVEQLELSLMTPRSRCAVDTRPAMAISR